MIKITLRFDQTKVSKAESDFSKIELYPELKVLLQQIAELMSKFLPLSILAIKGNTWYSIKEWQKKNKRSISEISTMPPNERLETAKQLFVLGKERMKHMLSDPEGQKDLIDEAYDKAWNIYTQYIKG